MLRGANQGEPPQPPPPLPPPSELRPFLTLPATSSPRACPQTPLRFPPQWGRKGPHPPTRVRSPPHGAAGPSVSAREGERRRRRRLRLTSPPPPSLPFSPPPGPSASEEGQEPFWELSFSPSPQSTYLSSPQSHYLNRVKLRMNKEPEHTVWISKATSRAPRPRTGE